ncbi:MAG: transcription antitermination factor NusB [Bacteroidales bacterium]|nr:transcription antitermination factor NusB [Bacteroidales bacterium]
MLTRRFLRVKAFKILFSYAYSDNDSLLHAEKELNLSFEKTYDLYHFLFSAIIAVADYAEERIETGLKKFKPRAEELDPNRKFIRNKLIALIRTHKDLQQYCSKKGLNWRNYPETVRSIYQNMIEHPYYKNYMSSEDSSFDEDVRFVHNFFRHEFEGVEKVEALIEDLSAYWSDDIGFVLSNIIQTLGTFKSNQEEVPTLPTMFRDKEDQEFAQELLRRSMMHFKEYTQMSQQFVQNWDSERIAYVDMALIVMGVAEAVYFSNIPVKVTINEYVEISKYYSTRNSHIFINGVLDKIIQNLLQEGKVKKTGRGLIQESINKKIKS